MEQKSRKQSTPLSQLLSREFSNWYGYYIPNCLLQENADLCNSSLITQCQKLS